MRGVPDCFRGIVWQKLSGADQVVPFHRGVYEQLLETEVRFNGCWWREKQPEVYRIWREIRAECHAVIGRDS